MTNTKLVDFRLPDLGEGMEEAEISAWNVAEGQEVALDQSFVDVQTDKAVVEIPSPYAGRIVHHHFAPGDIAKVGAVITTFEVSQDTKVADAAHGHGAPEPAPPPSPASPPPVDEAKPVAAVSSAPLRKGRPKAAPTVRRLAQELGLDLATIAGSGPDGRILAEDLRRPDAAVAVAEPAATVAGPAPVSVPGAQREDRHITLSGISLRTAEVMANSWATVAHTWSLDEFDATELLKAVKHMRSRQKDGDAPISMMSFFVMAVAQSLRLHPMQNASLDLEARELVLKGRINIRFAVATPNGLRVPVIKDADQRGLLSIAAELDRLIKAGRAGKIEPADMQDGTFTITNYGALGSRFALPLIRPPEVGIIGFGETKLRPWVVGEDVVARQVMPLVSCIDHRVLGGDESFTGGLPTGGFRNSVIERLENPLNLLGGS